MGGAGIHSIKSVEQNLQSRRSKRKSMFQQKDALSSRQQAFTPVYMSTEEKKHLDNIARKAKYTEMVIHVSLYAFILLGLFWWWFY